MCRNGLGNTGWGVERESGGNYVGKDWGPEVEATGVSDQVDDWITERKAA